MERYRLKNIIILILALLNTFLLSALAWRGTAAYSAHRVATEQLVSLFESDGIDLDAPIIPSDSPPSALALTRDLKLEQQVASFLLGSPATGSDQGGGIYTYNGQNGAAVFRDTGNFDVAGTLSSGDPQAFCEDFCDRFGYEELTFRLDENQSGTATAVGYFEDWAVFNCTVTFTIDRGAVMVISGSLLSSTAAQTDSGVEFLSAMGALSAFQQMRPESGAAVSAILEITPCYELQSTPTDPVALVPAWHIDTDTVDFYVNCVTGAVRRL